MHEKIQKLIQARNIYRKINQKLPNTHEQAQITAKENAAWGTKTWTELAEIIREIQKNECPLNEKDTKNAHTPEIYTGEEENANRLAGGKHLTTHKWNINIYALENGSAAIKCTPYFNHGRGGRTPSENPKANVGKTIRKAEIKTTMECIRKTNTKLREINRNAQQLRNKWSTRGNKILRKNSNKMSGNIICALTGNDSTSKKQLSENKRDARQ